MAKNFEDECECKGEGEGECDGDSEGECDGDSEGEGEGDGDSEGQVRVKSDQGISLISTVTVFLIIWVFAVFYFRWNFFSLL